MNGDVAYENLSIEDGAVIEGRCQRRSSGKAADDAKVSTLKPAGGKGDGAKEEKSAAS